MTRVAFDLYHTFYDILGRLDDLCFESFSDGIGRCPMHVFGSGEAGIIIKIHPYGFSWSGDVVLTEGGLVLLRIRSAIG